IAAFGCGACGPSAFPHGPRARIPGRGTFSPLAGPTSASQNTSLRRTIMDLNTVSEVARPTTRGEVGGWRDGDAWLAGGTWLFSEPQPRLRRLIDLEGLRWEPLTVSEQGLAIAATCTIGRLDALGAPGEWRAAPLIRQCCQSLLASFKVLNVA